MLFLGVVSGIAERERLIGGSNGWIFTAGI
jgi:hypothetical protein